MPARAIGAPLKRAVRSGAESANVGSGLGTGRACLGWGSPIVRLRRGLTGSRMCFPLAAASAVVDVVPGGVVNVIDVVSDDEERKTDGGERDSHGLSPHSCFLKLLPIDNDGDQD